MARDRLPRDRTRARGGLSDARRFGLHLVFAVLAALAFAATSGGLATRAVASETAASALAREMLVVVSVSGRHKFQVEIADTNESRARGLMFRETLAPDAGMLFDFQLEREVAFWMKNTLISLDMLFIEASGRIAHIARDTVPLSLELVPSRAKVRYVLEVPAGTAARLGIQPGDVVQSPTIAAGQGE